MRRHFALRRLRGQRNRLGCLASAGGADKARGRPGRGAGRRGRRIGGRANAAEHDRCRAVVVAEETERRFLDALVDRLEADPQAATV